MKKRFFNSAALILVLLLSFSVLSVKPSAVANTSNGIIAAVSDKSDLPDSSKVRQARFLNMLNHNFVYNEAFNSVEDIVNASVPALLNMRDPVNESYIAESYVKDYVYNMYGVEIEDFSDINNDFAHLDGYVYIIPRGFSVFSHKIDSVSLNEDGSFTVVTSVSIDSHDGDSISRKAVSLFVKNDRSRFGYNIISSEISDSLNDI